MCRLCGLLATKLYLFYQAPNRRTATDLLVQVSTITNVRCAGHASGLVHDNIFRADIQQTISPIAAFRRASVISLWLGMHPQLPTTLNQRLLQAPSIAKSYRFKRSVIPLRNSGRSSSCTNCLLSECTGCRVLPIRSKRYPSGGM